MPKVSVIITTYNRAKELRMRCLPSIFTQTFKDYEVIVVDDCSSDETILQEENENIRFFRNEVNKGKSYSVNYAVKQAKGEYIVVVDDDNELMPTFLEETVNALDTMSKRWYKADRDDGHFHPKIDAVQVGRIIRHLGYDDYAAPQDHSGYGFSSIDWGWLIRKEVFDEIHYDENIFGDEDADFGIQFFQRFHSLPLNKPLTIAYAEGEGVCSPSPKRIDSLMRFYHKNKQFYQDAGPKDASFLERYVARTLYLGGDKQRANIHFWEAFKIYPKMRTLIHFLVSLINYSAYYYLMRIEEKYYARKRMAMSVLKDLRLT